MIAKRGHVRIETHIVQGFGPHILNRGKSNEPKTAHLGGVRRNIVTSQCWKRAMRDVYRDLELFSEDELAFLTNRLVDEVAGKVTAPAGTDPERVRGAVARALAGGGIKVVPETQRTQYLLFIPKRIILALAELVSAQLEPLLPPPAAATSDTEPAPGEPKKAAGKANKKAEKAAARQEVSPDLQQKIAALLADSARTPEIALYGRMVADEPGRNVEAACQVAWAISTHSAEIGWDGWTGTSDGKPLSEAGADMLGNAAFASGSCFYRYLSLDLGQLRSTLGEDSDDLAKRSVGAYIRASILAIPSGKQNSMGAQCLPQFVLVEVRAGGARNLSNAYEVPIYPSSGAEHGGLLEKSVLCLGDEVKGLDKMYHARGRRSLAFAMLDPGETLAPAFMARVPGATHCVGDGDLSAIDRLIDGAVTAAFAP